MKEILFKPVVATFLMAICTFLCNKGFGYINIPTSLNTIITILFAIASYAFILVKFNILSNEEIMQLPYGNKICKIIDKRKKK